MRIGFCLSQKEVKGSQKEAETQDDQIIARTGDNIIMCK